MSLRVSYTVGKGTGKEVADVFERVMRQLSTYYFVPIELHASSHSYHSYSSLLEDYGDPEGIREGTLRDVLHYEKFLKEQAAQGTRVTFQTATNAQFLHLVRQHLQAVTVECFNQGTNSLLLVSDQSQGFYTGSNQHDLPRGTVSRSCQFSKDLTNRIVAFSIDRARQLWGQVPITSVTMVYRFDLLDGVLTAWATEFSATHNIKFALVTPATATQTLLASGVQGHQLIIAGNECADIIPPLLRHILPQPTAPRTTQTTYLDPALHLLTEYQPVLASSNNDIVNPTSTVRAAASILEHYAGAKGIVAATDLALESLRRRDVRTPDEGGSRSTGEVVECVLDTLTAASLAPGYLGLGR